MRNIILKPCGVGRYDDVSPFLITDNRLELLIGLPPYNGEFYLVYNLNGKTEQRLLSPDGEIVLYGLSAGEFKAEVKHYLKGELIKTYSVEPLILKEADSGLSAEPQISELKRRISELEHSFAEYKNAVRKAFDGLTERLWKTESNIAALMNFAYEDYKNNAYLSGGNKEEFLKEYGFIGGNENEESN